jgi:ABC-2 type transport system permease protein
MRASLVLALKDLRLLSRDRAAAFFTFVFPLAIALFFGYVFSGTTAEPMRVAAFVESASPASDALVRALSEDGAFVLNRVESREDGERLVRSGTAAALVVVPASYAAGVDGMLTGAGPHLGLVVDPSRRAEGSMLVGKVHEVGFRTVFSSMADPVQFGRAIDRMEASLKDSEFSASDKLAIRVALGRARSMAAQSPKDAGGGSGSGMSGWKPVSVDVTELAMRPGIPANSFAISFTQGVAWALFGAVLAFGSGIAEERQRGTLVRLRVSPMSPNGILMGKALACFLTCMATEWLLVFVGIAFFHVAVSSWLTMVVVIAVTAFGFSGLMMLLAAGFRTEGGTQGAGRAVLLVLAMVGGGTVPLVFMPPFLRAASNISPFKWAVMAAEGATWRNWGPDEMWLPLAVLAAIGAVGLTAGTALVRRSI